MAGVLYLYRLLVYHAEEDVAVVKERLQTMQRRLWRAITLPAMIVAVCAGLGMLALDPRYYLRAHWLHAKLAVVLALIYATAHAGRVVARMARGEPVGPGRRYRVLNEVPTLLMLLIVFLVVFKPF